MTFAVRTRCLPPWVNDLSAYPLAFDESLIATNDFHYVPIAQFAIHSIALTAAAYRFECSICNDAPAVIATMKKRHSGGESLVSRRALGSYAITGAYFHRNTTRIVAREIRTNHTS